MTEEVRVKILLPIYVQFNQNIRRSLIGFLKSLLSDLDISEIIVINPQKRFTEIAIRGADAHIAGKFLEKEFGKSLTWNDLRDGEEYRGIVRSVNNNAFYVDIGLVDPDYFRVKITFKEFIRSLFRVSKDIPEDLFNLFGIRQYFPIYVKVVFSAGIDENKRVIFGSLSRRSVNMLLSWLRMRLDRLIIYGATRSQVEKAVKASGHFRDVVSLERLGFLEYALVCKWGTSAKGLIPELGPYLPSATFAPFYPRLIKKRIKLL
ncbi:MAG: hypothetical protein DRZ80_02595 [Thermoprotei archaeon]|nr:MAG: hypothetical protein DRZ80_02595 [Thermoprotei archaeon]